MSIGKKMATSARLVNRRITSAVLANTTTYCTTVDYVMIIVGAAPVVLFFFVLRELGGALNGSVFRTGDNNKLSFCLW